MDQAAPYHQLCQVCQRWDSHAPKDGTLVDALLQSNQRQVAEQNAPA